ncbi:MAG TPA: hypothetical protein IAC79_04165, partial [Candidatus Spyradenecus faecavium]|nr:hypothetical protein [Candidatus Spyradenecus faecavium]
LRADDAKARRMKPDGTYALPPPSDKPFSAQDALRQRYAELNAHPIPPPEARRPGPLARLLAWLTR